MNKHELAMKWLASGDSGLSSEQLVYAALGIKPAGTLERFDHYPLVTRPTLGAVSA